jgi:predicted metal-dependent hydrolase
MMIPTRRDLSFGLSPESVADWHSHGPYVTHFINAMSLFFPEGERFFIDSVRHYRGRITDPLQREAVSAFIGQEAMHGREHDEYNRLLRQAGLPAQEIEAHVRGFLRLLRELPPAAQLSATIAMEHFTAVMSRLMLTDPRFIAGADARLAALWRWHALEETEHKAVAFDVYRQVMGGGARAYVLRGTGLVVTTAVFLALVLGYQRRLLQAGRRRSWRGRMRFLGFMFLSPALLPRVLPRWLDYLRPGFHPWDHDDRWLLGEIPLLERQVRQFTQQAA